MTTPDLNAALAVYLLPATLPKDEALDFWLEQHCPPAQRKQTRRQVTDVVGDATDAVCNEPCGVRFTPEFWQRLHQHLAVRHPWLTLTSVQGLQGYLGWYCWHEGLFAPDGP